MNNVESENNISWRIAEWFPEIPVDTTKKLKTYLDELIQFNRSINLIPVKTILTADAIHFADSVLASRIIVNDSKATEIVDLGSGNGFPGLVLAALYPKVNVTLVEADPKKCEFLKAVIQKLDLKNAKVTHERIDKLPNNSVTVGVVRGFGNLTKTLLAARKVVNNPGTLYHIKSDNWGMELAEIPSQLCSIFEPSLAGEYRLPTAEQKLAVIKTVKIRNG